FLVEATSIDAMIRDPANELILADEMPMRMTQELLLKGLCVSYPVEWNRDPEAPPWPLWLDVGLLRRHSGAMTRVQLLQMVDAALHADTDSITLCTAEGPNEDAPLALLWAQTPQDGWAAASLGAVSGEATPARLPASASPALNIAATHGAHADYVLVEWDAPRSSGMTEVLRSAPGDVTFSSIGMTSGNVFRDVTAETCVRYAYRVRRLTEDGVGIESELSRGYVGEVPETVPAIQATDGNEPNGIRVEWTPAEGATEYILYRCEPVSAPTQNSSKVYLVYRGPETRFLDTDVIAGTTYRYTAIPLNGCGTSAVGNPANQGYASHVEPPNDTVVPPQWFRATLVSPDDHIELAWCPVPGADEYQVCRASAYAGLYEWVATTSTTAWRDDDAEYCQDYWYRIRTMSGDGVSQLSAVAYGVCGCKPGKPLEVGVSEAIYPDSIRIEWEAGERAQWTWVLRANEPDGPYTKIGQTEDCVYVDTGLVPGQQFWYRLEARNECGGSGWTSQIRGSTTPE
ncbi:hypothetical protein JW848_04580, partial [Candidatus Bipolaricaulota bacterium]|nr:hypothetical protein [Candidatus Bipolaricaulota bacterium]